MRPWSTRTTWTSGGPPPLPGGALDEGDEGGKALPRGRPGGEGEEEGEVGEAGKKLLYPHEGHVDPGEGGGKPYVPLVLHEGQGAGFRHQEVGPADAELGGEEGLP